MMQRLPMESRQPIVTFGFLRLAMTLAALAAIFIFSIPNRGGLAILIVGAAVPWSVAVYLMSRRGVSWPLAPWVPVFDIALLAGVELISPDTYAAVRFFALFIIAAHALLLGEERGAAIAVLAAAVLIPIGLLEPHPTEGKLIGFYETVFAVSAIAGALFIGRLRTGESVGRLRARELSRRAIEAENDVRRRLAEAIHDGPVQELVSLDIMLSAVRSSLEHDDREGALSSVNEAQAIAERNIRSLREEIVGLGPYAFDELTVMAALEQCAPLWARRYGFDIRLDIEDLDLPDDVCGALFGVAQEAVANAGRHAGADTVTVSLHQHDGQVVMHVRDDGSGFGDIAPLGAHEVGHIGLASMRERAELIGGLLEIDSGPEGTDVGVRVLLEDPQPTKRRRRFRPSAG